MSEALAYSQLLTDRWYPLRYYPEQARRIASTVRFMVTAAGARSGKTEIHKREGVIMAMGHPVPDAQIIFAAPTRDQAKQIYWDDLKALVPRWAMRREPMETELSIKLKNGPTIRVVGMDKPQRVEGNPIDWICLDEYRDMKADTWEAVVSPMLSTRGRPPGLGRILGRPRAGGHYHQLFKKALRDDEPEWDAFHWSAEEILLPEEIESAKRRMDPVTYAREYKADWINYEGRAYYAFDSTVHGVERLKYDKNLPLIFCFDFNVSPGVAAVVQELPYKGTNPAVADIITAVIGEVWIPRNSNTPTVCLKLLHDWGHHEGTVYCYGDFTGGARGSAKVWGSDWDQAKKVLAKEYGPRLRFNVKPNPLEGNRVTTVNTRFMSADNKIHMLIDPVNAPHALEDFEGVTLVKGGSGEIEKIQGDVLTHMSDAIGYYIYLKHPIREHVTSIQQL